MTAVLRLHAGNLTKVLLFVLITGLMSTVVGLTIGRIKIQPTSSYSADFVDASGLKKGVDVRAAGVNVGTVKDLELRNDNLVRVKFSVPKEIPLTTVTEVRIRYANLTGDRYLELTQPSSEVGEPLAAESVIPVERTQPALDLDALYDGFQPLLDAISPADINDLTESLIAVTQGQGNAVEALLTNVGSFTRTIADRDDLVGQVVSNLNAVLGTVDERSADVNKLITGLGSLVKGLADDRKVLGNSLVRVNRLAESTGLLVEEIRPGLKLTVAQLQRVTKQLTDGQAEVIDVLERYPEVIGLIGRAGAYGSFFNFYLCGSRVKFSDPVTNSPITTPWIISTEARCNK